MPNIKICAPSRIYDSYAGGHFSAASMVDYMSQVGFDGVDISLENIDRYGDSWQSVFYSVKTRAAAKNLEIPSCHLPFYMPEPTNKLLMDRFAAEIKKGIDVATHIGIQLAVLHPIALHSKKHSAQEWARANVEFLSPICQYAKAKGLRILIENMASSCEGEGDHLYGCTASEILALAEALTVECCWDFGHANLSGRPAGEVALLGDKLALVHIHDNNGYTDNHLVPFDGTVDWTCAMKALHDIGYKGYFNIEVKASQLDKSRDVREEFGRRAAYIGQRLARMTE